MHLQLADVYKRLDRVAHVEVQWLLTAAQVGPRRPNVGIGILVQLVSGIEVQIIYKRGL